MPERQLLANDHALLVCFDPRWKLAAVLSVVAAALWLRNPSGLLQIFLFTVGLAVCARVSPRQLLSRLGLTALILAPFAVLQPVVGSSGEAWWVSLMRLYAKALSIVTLALFFTATTPPMTSLKAAESVFVPGLLLRIGLLTYRYLFVFSRELRRMGVAMQVRGFRAGPNRHTYRTTAHMAGTLLVRGYERAERVGQAMRCRGFEGRFHSLTRLRTRVVDVALFALMTAAALAITVASSILS
jgi:cobalt/nickel transport system permease protein